MLAPPLKLLGGPGPPSSYAYGIKYFVQKFAISCKGGLSMIISFFSGVLQSMPGVSKDMNGYRDFEGGHLRTSSYAK